jgi:hypothetical protein
MEGPSLVADSDGQGNQRQAERHMATELEVAWAAGFFDGEGSVSIRRLKSGKGQYMRRTYGTYIRIAQVDRSPLDLLVRIFGTGSVSKSRKYTETRAPYYDLCMGGSSAAMILARMLPYLTVKRERALLALEFQQRVAGSRKGRSKTGYRLSDEEMQIRHTYWLRMRTLNLRQVSRAAAETKSKSLLRQVGGCDSPVCTDDKGAEGGRNDHPLKLVG